MSLVDEYIDSFGGYDAAKEKNTTWMINHGENWRNIKDATLLEYRREHNIFEVGDKVVSDFYQLDCVFLISHVCNDDEFIYSNKVFSLGSVFTTSDKLKGECRFLFNEIRHATDEEIKAGKRL